MFIKKRAKSANIRYSYGYKRMETDYIYTTSNRLSLSLSLSLSLTHTHFHTHFVIFCIFPILQQYLPSPSFDTCTSAATTTPALTTPPQTTTTPPATTTPRPGRVFSFCAVQCCSVVRTFADRAMGRRFDPSWWTH